MGLIGLLVCCIKSDLGWIARTICILMTMLLSILMLFALWKAHSTSVSDAQRASKENCFSPYMNRQLGSMEKKSKGYDDAKKKGLWALTGLFGLFLGLALCHCCLAKRKRRPQHYPQDYGAYDQYDARRYEREPLTQPGYIYESVAPPQEEYGIHKYVMY